MKNTLRDAVKVAEDAGLDAQVTIEEGELILIATIPGPRRDARDYVARSITTIHADGSVGDFQRFADDCKAYVASLLPKATDRWFEFTWPAVGLRAVGNMGSWGFGTMEQAVEYAARHRHNTTFVEVSGPPDDDGATIVNLTRAFEYA